MTSSYRVMQSSFNLQVLIVTCAGKKPCMYNGLGVTAGLKRELMVFLCFNAVFPCSRAMASSSY